MNHPSVLTVSSALATSQHSHSSVHSGVFLDLENATKMQLAEEISRIEEVLERKRFEEEMKRMEEMIHATKPTLDMVASPEETDESEDEDGDHTTNYDASESLAGDDEYVQEIVIENDDYGDEYGDDADMSYEEEILEEIGADDEADDGEYEEYYEEEEVLEDEEYEEEVVEYLSAEEDDDEGYEDYGGNESCMMQGGQDFNASAVWGSSLVGAQAAGTIRTEKSPCSAKTTTNAAPPVKRSNFLADLTSMANARNARLEDDPSELRMHQVRPEMDLPKRPMDTFDLTAMVSQVARDRESRLQAGGEKKMTTIKSKKEIKEDYKSIVVEAAALGRLTRLNEHFVEAVAVEKTAQEEWRSKGLLAIQWRTQHMAVIHEAARAGAASRLPEKVVSNIPDEEEPEDYYEYNESDATQKRISERMKQLLQLSTEVGTGQHKVDSLIMGRKEEKALEGRNKLVKPMQCYTDIADVKLPRRKAPKVDPAKEYAKIKAKLKGTFREDKPLSNISGEVAELAWSRRTRLDRPGAMPRVTEVCHCPYCLDPTPYQTHAYIVKDKERKQEGYESPDSEEERIKAREQRRLERRKTRHTRGARECIVPSARTGAVGSIDYTGGGPMSVETRGRSFGGLQPRRSSANASMMSLSTGGPPPTMPADQSGGTGEPREAQVGPLLSSNMESSRSVISTSSTEGRERGGREEKLAPSVMRPLHPISSSSSSSMPPPPPPIESSRSIDSTDSTRTTGGSGGRGGDATTSTVSTTANSDAGAPLATPGGGPASSDAGAPLATPGGRPKLLRRRVRQRAAPGTMSANDVNQMGPAASKGMVLRRKEVSTQSGARPIMRPATAAGDGSAPTISPPRPNPTAANGLSDKSQDDGATSEVAGVGSAAVNSQPGTRAAASSPPSPKGTRKVIRLRRKVGVAEQNQPQAVDPSKTETQDLSDANGAPSRPETARTSREEAITSSNSVPETTKRPVRPTRPGSATARRAARAAGSNTPSPPPTGGTATTAVSRPSPPITAASSTVTVEKTRGAVLPNVVQNVGEGSQVSEQVIVRADGTRVIRKVTSPTLLGAAKTSTKKVMVRSANGRTQVRTIQTTVAGGPPADSVTVSGVGGGSTMASTTASTTTTTTTPTRPAVRTQLSTSGSKKLTSTESSTSVSQVRPTPPPPSSATSATPPLAQPTPPLSASTPRMSTPSVTVTREASGGKRIVTTGGAPTAAKPRMGAPTVTVTREASGKRVVTTTTTTTSTRKCGTPSVSAAATPAVKRGLFGRKKPVLTEL